MDHTYFAEISRDEAAGVWCVSETNFPGLVAEAASECELQDKIRALVPELYELNRNLFGEPAVEAIHLRMMSTRLETILLLGKGEPMPPLSVTAPASDTIVYGFDSAWTDKSPGAVCALSFDSNGRAAFDAPELVKFEEALDYIVARRSSAARKVVALDQPTIVPNAKGMRPAERVAASVLSFTGGGVQPAYTGKAAMFGAGAPIWKFKNGLAADDDPERARGSASGVFLLEVFPALALPGLHAPFAGRLCAPKYNPKSGKFRLADWGAVVKATVGIAAGLGLTDCAEWCSGLSTTAKPAKSDQDRLDAAICALVGYIWLACAPSASRLLGDVEKGYIVTPVSRATSKRLGAAAAKKSVPCR